VLCDDVLLSIFRHCLDAAPKFWPTLGFVCQRWRQILLNSPLGLNLRLHCTHGTPVLKALSCWPTLPIVILYGGIPDFDPPAPEDEDNIIAALKQSARVRSISLTITSSLLEKLSIISEPFPELEELILRSRDNIQLTLPSTFRWGFHLRTLHSTSITFLSFPHLLSPCQGLVDLELKDIPGAGYFSPEAFANALSDMNQLRFISLRFPSFPSRRNDLSLPPPSGERIILPTLTRFKYRGTSKYLDTFVARIDAPRLGDIDIAFFAKLEPTMDASELGRFIKRTGVQTSLSQADITTSAHIIFISFANSSTSTPLKLQISCTALNRQLACMAQVCNQFSPFLFRVEELKINTTNSSSVQDDAASEQWLNIVRSFDGARDLQIAGKHTKDIICALSQADGETNLLPALRHLRVENPIEMDELSLDALLSFITSRSLSGRPVQVNVPLFQCHVCHAGFREAKGLDRHLEDRHAYRIMCLHCANFRWTTGHNDLFREHLDIEHPEVTLNDPIIWSPLSPRSSPSQLESRLRLHISVRAPDIVAPSPTITIPHSQFPGTPTPEP
jgi:hypothetical protein